MHGTYLPKLMIMMKVAHHGVLHRSVKKAREVQPLDLPLPIPSEAQDDEVCLLTEASTSGDGEGSRMDDEGNFTSETLESALDEVLSQTQIEGPPIHHQTGQPVDLRSLSCTELLMSEDYDVLNAIFDPAFSFRESQTTNAPSRMGEAEEAFDVDALLGISSL